MKRISLPFVTDKKLQILFLKYVHLKSFHWRKTKHFVNLINNEQIFNKERNFYFSLLEYF